MVWHENDAPLSQYFSLFNVFLLKINSVNNHHVSTIQTRSMQHNKCGCPSPVRDRKYILTSELFNSLKYRKFSRGAGEQSTQHYMLSLQMQYSNVLVENVLLSVNISVYTRLIFIILVIFSLWPGSQLPLAEVKAADNLYCC